MTTPNDLPSVGTEDALSVDVLTDLCALHDRTGGGAWVQGMSSHETVLKREGQPDYHVAHFRHADYASFVDAAHKYMPLLIGEVTDLRRERDELASRVRELEGERDRALRNRDMWKGQCERQAEQLTALRVHPHASEAITWTPETGYVFANDALTNTPESKP